MIRKLCTTGSLALLSLLTACTSLPTKENTPAADSISTAHFNDRMKADSLFILSDVYSREGKAAQSAELLEQVATLDPSSPFVHTRLAAEYLKLNKKDKALMNAEKAVEKDPMKFESRMVLGGLYAQEKAYDKAMIQYNEAMKIDPKNNDAPLFLVSLYTEQKDFKKAEKFFTFLLKNPNFTAPHIVHFYMGLMHVEQSGSRHEALAESAFKKSLSEEPGFQDVLMSLAHLYLHQEKSHKALELCLKFQKERGYSQQVADLIAQIYIEKGDSEKAYSQFELIIENSDPSVDTQMKMALLLIEQKRYNLAASTLSEIVNKSPSADGARYYLAAVQEQNGDLEDAIKNFTLVSAESEHFGEALVHAAYLLKGMGKINQALVITEKGLKSKAPGPKLYTMHASLLDAKADYLGAARILEEGLSNYADNAEILFQHALVMERLGKKSEMMVQLKKVVEVEPNHLQGLSYLAFSLAELNQHLAEAEKLARRALALSPSDAYVLDTLGWVLFKQKKFADSIKYLEMAHENQSTAGIIAEHLADAYSMQAMTDKARAMYEVAAGLTKGPTRSKEIRNKIEKLM